MRTTLRLVPLAALAFLITTGSLSASHASNCELRLKAHYKCSATFDDGGSSEYCLQAQAGIGGGLFTLAEQSGGFSSAPADPGARRPTFSSATQRETSSVSAMRSLWRAR
jgi:hypothetical protein